MKNRGFTLVEMLVVISIISLISSIALGSVTVARKKAADATIKADLVNARPQAEIYFSQTGTYDFVCTTTSPDTIFRLVEAAARVSRTSLQFDATGSNTLSSCNDKPDDQWGPTGWAAEIVLVENPGRKWCVDNLGNSLSVTGSALANPPSGAPPGFDVTCN